ncbi:MAG: tetratricopeptide repeat protein [Verrucomicrobiota bacterium]|jgi:tetratricopeptide (TPR) repeat protein
MPYTINGIGTRYFGKQNPQQRVGVCRSCGRNVTLASYDTRLWFVVVFIPVIPLGRKHIIDECPGCRRHFVAAMDKWEMARQLETSGALERFRSDPTAENAIQAHQQLTGFHQLAEAAELQRTMQEKFGDNAKVQTYLAGALVQLGKAEEAATLYQRALELRPDLPEARIGLAELHIRAGRLDEAGALLDFLEKPGAAQLYSLAPLEHLAIGCQKAGRHAEALEHFGKILQGLPQVGQNPVFRGLVKTSEKALGRTTTILPKAKFSLRRFLSQSRRPGGIGPVAASPKRMAIAIGVIAGIGLACMVVANGYIREHRVLYIANGTGAMLQGEISGIGRIKIPRGVTPITLHEGHYLATFDPPFSDEVAFDIRSKYFERWTHKPVWVLNPGGAAIILCQRVVYAKTPQPGSFKWEFGRKLAFFPDVEFPFTPPPPKMQVSSGEQQRVVSVLQLFQGAPVEAFNALAGARRPGEAYQLAEWRLTRNPDDQRMLEAYVITGAAGGDTTRIAEFLRGGMGRRPVRIEWHRAYQNLLLGGNRHRLVGEYDSMLAAEPGDSALLYLRGRLSADYAEGQDYFNRSLRADPANPYPAFALAFDAASTADWASAKRLLDPAIAQEPGNRSFLTLWSLACLGLNETGVVEEAWRQKLHDDPADLQAEVNLCQALVVGHKEAEAQAAVAEYGRAAGVRYGTAGETLAAAAKDKLLYMLGDFGGLEKMSRGDTSPGGRNRLFIAMIEENRPEEAARIHPLTDASLKDPFELLIMSLAWRAAGNSAEATKWQDRAVALFRASGDPEDVAGLLGGGVEPTAQALNTMAMAASSKAVLLANLAYCRPEQRKELAAMARRLNVQREFPYYLIERATEEPRQ